MSILPTARNYVENLFKDKLSSIYLYHNFLHTTNAVNRAQEIITHSSISQENAEKLLLAVWFHDVGYIEGEKDHEQRSAEYVRRFLQDKNFSAEYIAEVEKLILATQKNHTPNNLLEEMMKDADFSHLASSEFSDISERLRQELSLTGSKNFSQDEWTQENLDLLRNHHVFYTDYAKNNWEEGKRKNIKKLEKKLEKKDTKKQEIEINKKDGKSDRSIDTLFRVTLNNHTRLSDIADSKANILLSVNAIIISVCLTVLVPKLDTPRNAHLIIPTFLLLISSVLTIIFAILSTKPNVTKSDFNKEDIKKRKVNLLFFGNFQSMKLDDYQDAMAEMIDDRDYIYSSMIRDLYYLGKVLDRKYKLLSITYKIFMAGIIISVLSFGYALISL